MAMLVLDIIERGRETRSTLDPKYKSSLSRAVLATNTTRDTLPKSHVCKTVVLLNFQRRFTSLPREYRPARPRFTRCVSSASRGRAVSSRENSLEARGGETRDVATRCLEHQGGCNFINRNCCRYSVRKGAHD